jgi:hypothetical protein
VTPPVPAIGTRFEASIELVSSNVAPTFLEAIRLPDLKP